ncbi:M28 family peptidase [Novosphingobium sp. Gsoil 351]|uniref:M28 family peptidase n=1 Tax=Novosphingobium sp. Gsoil 351 TaxID=2675225 RepID=UPI001E38D021|nr:M28 family peptidase [Novosphingobium sp. Gsoil 351]
MLASLALGPAQAGTTDADRGLEAALRRHIETLASDDFGGREPGTDGESKTLRYLAREWFTIGLVSGTNDPGNAWFAPVELVERAPSRSMASFQRNRRMLGLPATGILVLTSGPRQLLEDAPLVFIGRGDGAMPPRGELAGRIVVLLDAPPAGMDADTAASRQDRLIEAGAGAVLTVLDGERTLEAVAERRTRAGYALADDQLGGDLEAFVTADYATGLFGPDWPALVKAADTPGVPPRPLPLTGTLEATTRETRISTHNLVGRLPGRNPERGAVLLVAHWDHFGTCAAPPAEDLICNGAIDNASGLAVLTEVARVLAKGRRLDRDVYFLATSAEELGLLGAHAFAENPPLPLASIVAAFNIDSPAIGPAGQPLTVIGHGRTELDGDIAKVARSLKVKIETNPVADGFLHRQDGWALLQHDIPAVMVSSSYSDPARVERFMDTTYHRPSDQIGAGFELGGAVEDVAVQVALVRWFASVKNYPRIKPR